MFVCALGTHLVFASGVQSRTRWILATTTVLWSNVARDDVKNRVLSIGVTFSDRPRYQAAKPQVQFEITHNNATQHISSQAVPHSVTHTSSSIMSPTVSCTAYHHIRTSYHHNITTIISCIPIISYTTPRQPPHSTPHIHPPLYIPQQHPHIHSITHTTLRTPHHSFISNTSRGNACGVGWVGLITYEKL